MSIAKGWPALVALLALSACGGGGQGGGGNGGDPSVLSLMTSMPANGATAVARNGSIVLTFSTTLDPATVAHNVSLTTPAGNQTVITSFAGNTLTVAPLNKLAPLLSFRVTVDTGLRGTNGAALSTPLVLNFTTADQQWQTAARIEPVGPTTTENPHVAVDRQGNAIAVWQRRDGVTRSIWSNRFAVGPGWGTPVQISVLSSANTDAELADIAVDVSGNVTVVWQQLDNGLSTIWSNRYIPGTGWGSPSQIQTRTAVTGDAFDPHIAVDALGNALAIWSQFEGGVFEIWANRNTAGAGWGTAVRVETNPGNATNARVAFDAASGRAFAVWNQGAGSQCLCVWSNQFTVGSGWGTPQMIASGSAVSAFAPAIAVDGLGNAYAVWSESADGHEFDVWSNRFAVGGTWGTAARVNDQMGGSGPPKIAADANGNAYAIWEQVQANQAIPTIRWNAYRAGSGWGTPGLIALATDVANGTGGNPSIALDASGVANAMWEHDDGTQVHVRSSRLAPSAIDWSQPVDARSTEMSAGPNLAVDANGDITAVWEQLNDSATGVAVWSNRFE